MRQLHKVKNLIPSQSLEAYAFPLVVRAFGKYGFPTSLAKLDSKMAGRLAVALAAEIAIVTTFLLVEALRRVPNHLEVKQLPASVSPKAKKEYKEASAQREAVYREVRDLEREISELLPPNLMVFVGEVGCLSNRASLRRIFANISEEDPNKPKLAAKVREYDNGCLSMAEANLQYYRARYFFTETGTQLVQASEMKADDKTSNTKFEEPGQINFKSHAGILTGGCIGLLREHDPDWWWPVAAFVESEVNRNIKSNPVKFLLRHRKTFEAVDAVLEAMKDPKPASDEMKARLPVYNNLTDADLILTVLKDECKANFQIPTDWFKEGSESANFKTLRASLRQDDLNCQKWIQETGGLDHPFDFYAPDKSIAVMMQKEEIKLELQARLSEPLVK